MPIRLFILSTTLLSGEMLGIQQKKVVIECDKKIVLENVLLVIYQNKIVLENVLLAFLLLFLS